MISELLIDPFQYDFMVRALVAALFSGITLSLLGTFTINRSMGFMADAMAHATLPIIAVGVFFGFSISELGVPAAIVVALFLGYIVKNTNIGEDTSIGIIFSTFFALGFVLIKLLNVTINLEDLLFGQVLAVNRTDIYFLSIIFFTVIGIMTIYFKQILFYSFDPIGSEVKGLNTNFLNYLFLIVLSLSVVSSLQTVGIILVLSMLIIPAASAKLITNTFIESIKVSIVFGIISSVTGLLFSYHLDLPTGPSMSLFASLIFLLSFIFNRSKIKQI